jgi:hypothetical protein
MEVRSKGQTIIAWYLGDYQGNDILFNNKPGKTRKTDQLIR